mgnify:CR=1 FL=1
MMLDTAAEALEFLSFISRMGLEPRVILVAAAHCLDQSGTRPQIALGDEWRLAAAPEMLLCVLLVWYRWPDSNRHGLRH